MFCMLYLKECRLSIHHGLGASDTELCFNSRKKPKPKPRLETRGRKPITLIQTPGLYFNFYGDIDNSKSGLSDDNGINRGDGDRKI